MLEDRAAAGVDVRVLLPGKHIDHFWMRALQKVRYGSLRKRGVRLFEYEPSMMHAKTALVDGRLVVVGS
ncbi:MAG: phospholipase D-like domain-containing protein, partial [Myxococcaceae bacterium]